MYICPWAYDPWASGIHIRQMTNAYNTTIITE